MLTDVFKDDINGHIRGFDDYRPYPKCNERKAWRAVPSEIADRFLKAAESYIDHQFTPLSASMCLYTGRSDDLTQFDKVRGENHRALFNLVMAECIEDQGRFIKDIFNGIWAMLDEAVWYRPWKSPMAAKYPSVMVDVTEYYIELAASSTAHDLAVAYYLLGDKLDEISKELSKRLYSEMDRRIFKPYLERKDIWWMAYYRHYHKKMGVLYSINNFTPHCTNLVLGTFLMLEENDARRSAAVKKTMEILDNYLGFVKDDGWCDEGAGYWEMAYGGLNLVLEKIRDATGGYVDVFDNEKIKAMGRYLLDAHIGNGWFVNFADCHPVKRHLSHKIIKYGLNIGDTGLLKLAFEISRNIGYGDIIEKTNGFENSLFLIFNIDDIAGKYGKDIDHVDYLRHEHYYPESQVLTVREDGNGYKGLFLACKGGHNDENHNHNDAGNFIVYKDGKPLLVDPGVEKYIADTFNTNRYKMWTMQSRYHNLPTFNGVMQKETRKYRAEDVKLIKGSGRSGLSMNLRDAYEIESGLIKYNRTVIFDKSVPSIECIDEILMKDNSMDIEFSFMTPCFTVFKDGCIEFYSDSDYLACMRYESGLFEYSEEVIKFRCERLESEWNNRLKRISLRLGKKVRSLYVRFTIE